MNQGFAITLGLLLHQMPKIYGGTDILIHTEQSRLFFLHTLELKQAKYVNFLFTVKHTVIKETMPDFGNQKLDLTQLDPADLTQDECIEDPSEQLCLTEDCVKAG